MPQVCPNFVLSTWWPEESQRRGLSHSSDRVLWARLCITSPLSSVHMILRSSSLSLVTREHLSGSYCVSAWMRLRKLQSHRWQGPLSQGSVLEGQRALSVPALLAELSLSPPPPLLCVSIRTNMASESASQDLRRKECYVRLTSGLAGALNFLQWGHQAITPTDQHQLSTPSQGSPVDPSHGHSHL